LQTTVASQDEDRHLYVTVFLASAPPPHETIELVKAAKASSTAPVKRRFVIRPFLSNTDHGPLEDFPLHSKEDARESTPKTRVLRGD
jgi:hypothetical protein